MLYTAVALHEPKPRGPSVSPISALCGATSASALASRGAARAFAPAPPLLLTLTGLNLNSSTMYLTDLTPSKVIDLLRAMASMHPCRQRDVQMFKDQETEPEGQKQKTFIVFQHMAQAYTE